MFCEYLEQTLAWVIYYKRVRELGFVIYAVTFTFEIMNSCENISAILDRANALRVPFTRS